MTDPNVPATPAPAAPYAAAAPAGRPTNVLAIIALIGAFVFPLAGIIMGHIALGQIKKTGENGHGLALWGTILGYVFSALWLLIFLVSFIVPLMFLGAAGSLSTIPGY